MRVVAKLNIANTWIKVCVLLCCMLSDSVKSYKISDVFANISNLQIRINNKPQDYSAYTTSDFYEMCTRNGLKQRFHDFDARATNTLDNTQSTSGVGMVLCFKPSRDFSGELKENLISGDFQLDIQYQATQYTGSTTALAFTSRVVLVQSSLYSLEADKPVTSIDGISAEEYDRALSEGKVVGLVGDDREEMLGGGFFKDFKRTAHMILKPMSMLANAAAPMFGKEGQVASAVLNAASNLSGSGYMGAGRLGGAMPLSRQEQLRRAGLAL
jgi:hypothetical protein